MFVVFASYAYADGLPLMEGRYQGAVIVLELTKEQKQVIDHYRVCHLEHYETMNQYTPYIFTLTFQQTGILKASKGFSPEFFIVHETYRGDNDAGPHWNVVLRFSEDKMEIPLDLVLSKKEASKELEMQGWSKTNPCFPSLGIKSVHQSIPQENVTISC